MFALMKRKVNLKTRPNFQLLCDPFERERKNIINIHNWKLITFHPRTNIFLLKASHMELRPPFCITQSYAKLFQISVLKSCICSKEHDKTTDMGIIWLINLNLNLNYVALEEACILCSSWVCITIKWSRSNDKNVF